MKNSPKKLKGKMCMRVYQYIDVTLCKRNIVTFVMFNSDQYMFERQQVAV